MKLAFSSGERFYSGTLFYRLHKSLSSLQSYETVISALELDSRGSIHLIPPSLSFQVIYPGNGKTVQIESSIDCLRREKGC